MSLEWQLDDSINAAEPYEFENVQPGAVFLLALGAALGAIASVYLIYAAIELAIEARFIPSPPALQAYFD